MGQLIVRGHRFWIWDFYGVEEKFRIADFGFGKPVPGQAQGFGIADCEISI